MVKEIYRGENWIGGLFPNGINPGGKYNVCKGNNAINLYLIHMYDLNRLVELKEKTVYCDECHMICEEGKCICQTPNSFINRSSPLE